MRCGGRERYWRARSGRKNRMLRQNGQRNPVSFMGLVLVLALLVPAHAQFLQQGSKLVGTGVIDMVGAQGASVAISADGNTALIGGDEDGIAWVFTRTAGVWT